MISITPLPTADYFAQITQRINQTGTGDRVALMSMTFDPQNDGIKQLVTALAEAAERGADVTLLVDAHTFMFNTGGWPNGPVLWLMQLNPDTARFYQYKIKVIDRLKKAGCTVQVINEPKRKLANPFGGRSHIKLTIINDDIYLGGCNLTDTDTIDMMLHFTSPDTSAYLYDRVQAIAQTGHAGKVIGSDATHIVDDSTTLYLDAGKPGISTIYDHALQLLDEAQEYIVMTCQFFPDARTVKHLEAAIRRGVHVTLYFNDPIKQDAVTRLGHQLLTLKAKYFNSKMLSEHKLSKEHAHLHLKLIATERAAMVGSHNYVEAGVRFGTAEIALLQQDPAFSKAVVAAVQPLLD